MIHKLTKFALALLLVIGLSLQPTLGQSHQEQIKPFLTDDVIGIALIDLEKANLAELKRFMNEGKFLGPLENANMNESLAVLEKTRAKLKSVGVTRGYAILRADDPSQFGTSVVIPVSDADPAKAQKVIETMVSGVTGAIQTKVASTENAVYLSATDSQMNRLASERPTAPRDISGGLKQLENAAFGLLLFGDSDSRKVLGQIVNQLPEPFEKISGQMIANNVDWVGLKIELGESVDLSFDIETNDTAAAKDLQSILSDSMRKFVNFPMFQNYLPTEDARATVIQQLKPNLDGKRVSMSWNSKDEKFLIQLASKQAEEVRKAARITQDKNNLRQLILAMHNYESAWQHMPTAATRTKDGKPGLSWRVQILPFLGENELYQQFKLDEPWDSEHNIKLANKMPATFRSPLSRNIGKNKTIYQVPFSKRAFFGPNLDTPKGFKDLTDGSSNTLAIVTVADDEAAVWTRPDDWEVQAATPNSGLRKEKTGPVLVAMFDGSTAELPKDVPAETLLKLVTSAGGEIVKIDF